MSKGFRNKAVMSKSEMQETQGKAIDNLAQQFGFVQKSLNKALEDNFYMKKEADAMATLLKMKEVTRAAQKDDGVMIDFFGRLVNDDGTLGDIILGAEGYGFFVSKLGSGQLIPGLEDEMIGKTPGQVFFTQVTFPETYVDQLKGKKARFDIQIVKVFDKGPTDILALANTLKSVKAAREEVEKAKAAAKKADKEAAEATKAVEKAVTPAQETMTAVPAETPTTTQETVN